MIKRLSDLLSDINYQLERRPSDLSSDKNYQLEKDLQVYHQTEAISPREDLPI